MSGVSNFLDGLTDSQWDSMLMVVQDLQDSATPERLEALRKFLVSLNTEIDNINRKRDVLGQKATNIRVVINLVDEHLKGNPDLEVELLKNVLAMWESSLKVEIAELRPTEKLEKKYDTERKRAFLLQIQSLVSNLNLEIRQKTSSDSQTVCENPRK